MTPSADRTRAILAERARRLARSREADGVEGPLVPLLGFAVGRERFGIDVRAVEGVFRMRHVTPLPGAPGRVVGVTSWRGRLLTVLDLERTLGLERRGLDDRAWIIALAVDGERFGVLVGSIERVRDLDGSAIDPVEDDATGVVIGTVDETRSVLGAPELRNAINRGGAS